MTVKQLTIRRLWPRPLTSTSRMSFFYVLLFSLSLQTTAAQVEPKGTIALVGAQVLDGYESTPISDGVVVYQAGVITAVGSVADVQIPANATVIDVGGHTLLPGLIDSHVHVDLIGHGSYERYYAFLGGDERLDEVMPIAAKQMLRAGVTTALDLGAPFEILNVRRKIDSGQIPGPRLLVSGPWITRVQYDTIPDSYEVVISSPEEGALKALELIDRGADVIKTWEGLTLQDYRAIVGAAHSCGIKVHAHLYDPEAIEMAIEAGVDVFQHVGSAGNPPYENALINTIAHKEIPVVQTISHRVWVYPSTVAFPSRLQRAEYRTDMPDDIYEEFMDSFQNFHQLPYFRNAATEIRNSKQSARQFIEAGARMGVGTDAASPLNMHLEAIWREMSALVDSGMTPIQVISAATKTNAEILGVFAERGSLERGKQADILVVAGNPLEDIEALGRVALVAKGGVLWVTENSTLQIDDKVNHFNSP
ncbi:MAG: amidohydrolase family protein [Gammaproteobacteria bacterium]|nr:amidohydrolase family protein [Gammaproteobacteria bacterium]